MCFGDSFASVGKVFGEAFNGDEVEGRPRENQENIRKIR